jgi:hypothetical protein
MAVATRHLGWRLAEVVRQMRGVKYAAAAQGIGRFWRREAEDGQRAACARRLKAICQQSMFEPIAFVSEHRCREVDEVVDAHTDPECDWDANEKERVEVPKMDSVTNLHDHV